MIVREAKYRKVRRLVREQVSSEVYGCDCCKKAINMGLSGKHRAHLELTVFFNGKEAEHMQFCSWRCVLKKLPKIKTDYFISLPYLTFDGPEEKGLRAQDFFAAIAPPPSK
jgi:hypothetical protein